MPRIDWTRVLIVSLAVLATAGVILLAWRLLGLVRQTVAMLAVGAALAFIARPLVDRLSPILRLRGLAVAAVAVAGAAVIGGGLTLLAGPLVADLQDVLRDLPEWQRRAVDLLAGIRRWLAARGIAFDEADLIRQAGTRLQGVLTTVLESAAVITGRIGVAVAGTLGALVIAVYLLLDGARIRARVHELTPEPWRTGLAQLERSTAQVFGGYLRGQMLLGVIIGIIIGLGAELFGLPYSALVGLLAGVFELIPSVGALLGGVLPVALALAQPFPTVLYVLAFLLVVAQIENHLLVPRITGRAVGLHPLAALLALLAGLEVGGLVGAFLAAPVVSLAYRLLLDWWRRGLAHPTQAQGAQDAGTAPPAGDGGLRGLLRRLVGAGRR
ncbi:MAG TPA: AI-2E family transporter [Bacillota bacterium]